MRRARRVDANSTELCDAFERLGCSVWKVNDVVDVVIGYGGIAALVEIKNPKRPLSAQKLTPRCEKFRATWRGGMMLVKSEKDVEDCVAKIRRWAHILHERLALAPEDVPRSYGGTD